MHVRMCDQGSGNNAFIKTAGYQGSGNNDFIGDGGGNSDDNGKDDDGRLDTSTRGAHHAGACSVRQANGASPTATQVREQQCCAPRHGAKCGQRSQVHSHVQPVAGLHGRMNLHHGATEN